MNNNSLLKHWIFILCAIFGCIFYSKAETGYFILDIDDVNEYSFTFATEPLSNLVDGPNTIYYELGNPQTLTIAGSIESVTVDGIAQNVVMNMMCNIVIDDTTNGKTIVVTKKNGGNSGPTDPIAYMLLKIDNIENVEAVYVDDVEEYYPLYGIYNLQTGNNIIEVKHYVDIYLKDGLNYSGKGVFVDGVAVQEVYGAYSIDAIDDAIITVVTEEPQTYSIKVNIDNPENVSSLQISYRDKSFVKGENIIELPGETAPITIRLKDNGREHTVSIDGVEKDYSYGIKDYYEFNISNGSIIDIITEGKEITDNNDPNQPKDPEYDSTLTVIVDNSSHLTMTIDNNPVELSNGSNKIDFAFSSSAYFEPTSGWKLRRVTVNEEERNINGSGGCRIFLNEELSNAVIEVTTAPYTAEKQTMTIKIDDPERANVTIAGTPIEFTDNEYVLRFTPNYDELLVKPVEGCEIVSITGDGENMSLSSQGTFTLYLTNSYGQLPEILEITTSGTPVTQPVILSMTIEIDDPEHAVVTLGEKTLEFVNNTITFQYESGEEVLLVTPAEGFILESIYADGNANDKLDINEDGTFYLILNTDNIILPQVITISTSSSTNGIVITESNSEYDVFNIQGMLIKRNATSEFINTLPKGFYIISGKKVVIF